MFAKACALARQWTRPLIISKRHLDGTVEAEAATMFLVNNEGWALTAGHVFDSFVQLNIDQKKIKEAAEMNAKNPGCVSADPKWLTNQSVWYGGDMIRPAQVTVYRQIDVALVKLNNVPQIPSVPVFRDPSTIVPGTSVCRLGFPFVKITNEFVPESKAFKITGGIPMPFFPSDGIHTRNISSGPVQEGFESLWVETSTPGFKGQSGGPLFDTKGRIYGMQSRTEHMDLGFHPLAMVNGGQVMENQFANLGIAVHAKVLMDVLRKHGVNFTMAPADADDLSVSDSAATPVVSQKREPEVDYGSDGDKYIIQ